MDLYSIKAQQHFDKLKRLYERGAAADDEAIHHHCELGNVLHSAAADPTSTDAARIRALMEKADKILEEMKKRPPAPGHLD